MRELATTEMTRTLGGDNPGMGPYSPSDPAPATYSDGCNNVDSQLDSCNLRWREV